ncbi:MAG: hypothetical protein F6K14_17135 [Symploca sp. SIO2C1]|nr:hypothetical protein [Symploca sp. SIO2C1]
MVRIDGRWGAGEVGEVGEAGGEELAFRDFVEDKLFADKVKDILKK